jgi:hypothetical protein
MKKSDNASTLCRTRPRRWRDEVQAAPRQLPILQYADKLPSAHMICRNELWELSDGQSRQHGGQQGVCIGYAQRPLGLAGDVLPGCVGEAPHVAAYAAGITRAWVAGEHRETFEIG